MNRASKAGLAVSPVAAGVAQMAFAGEETVLVWTMTEPGSQHTRDARPFERVLYMVSGRLRLAIAGEATVMEATEMVVIPPHAEVVSATLDEAAVDLTIGRSE